MHHIAEGCRHQMEISSLDCNIDTENVVRFIDAFVCKLDLQKLYFAVSTIKDEGRPSYHSSIFLKIYLYGYLNGIRSSRKLERECTRNIEMQWLCGKLIPSYHSIADFRKDNPKALRNTFKLFVSFLKDIDLIGGELIAIDGTKIRAHNSKKNNYSQKKIERHFTFIENKISEYMAQLDKCDAAEDEIKITNITKKIEQLAARKIFYETLETELKESGDTQISTTDADARALLIQGQVVEVAYNTQAAVDDKHKLVAATHTIN
ncbi:MAG TPA: transposase, partial [Chitinophagales bacterium]|nr:transposase [Chitinophagales bacterium]